MIELWDSYLWDCLPTKLKGWFRNLSLGMLYSPYSFMFHLLASTTLVALFSFSMKPILRTWFCYTRKLAFWSPGNHSMGTMSIHSSFQLCYSLSRHTEIREKKSTSDMAVALILRPTPGKWKKSVLPLPANQREIYSENSKFLLV